MMKFMSEVQPPEPQKTTLRVQSWIALCQLCEFHACQMARLCKFPAARELTAAACRKFCAQAPPATDDDFLIRRMQETHAASIIGSMVHADGMARKWSSVAEQIFAEARKLVDAGIPRTEGDFSQCLLDSTAFGVKISGICHDEAMRRYKL